jgi:hypothetical protein
MELIPLPGLGSLHLPAFRYLPLNQRSSAWLASGETTQSRTEHSTFRPNAVRCDTNTAPVSYWTKHSKLEPISSFGAVPLPHEVLP